MEACRDRIKIELQRLEDLHYQLFDLMLQNDTPREKLGGRSPCTFILCWLRDFLHKNQGYHREIPPPGLSDPSVLVNVLFVLLRAVEGAMCDPDFLRSFDFAIYADENRALCLDFFDLSRIGGTLSHLKKARQAQLAAEGAPAASASQQQADAESDMSEVRDQAAQLILEALNLPFKLPTKRPVCLFFFFFFFFFF